MSTLTVTNIKATGETNSRAVSGVAAAWVQYDMRSSSHIDESANMSSLTDNGSGNATLSFSSNFGSADYGVAATTGRLGGSDNCSIRVFDNSVLPTVSAIKMYTYTSDSGNETDVRTNGVIFHGDLA